MNILLNILLLIVGFVLVIKGADCLVEGSSSLAKKMNISELVIGLTIISFGTSAPELVVNIISAFEKSNGLVFGNVIGSNLFNILLVLGVAGIIAPLEVKKGTVWREIPFVVLVSVILFVIVNDRIFGASDQDVLSRGDGFILLSFFLIFLAYVYAISREALIPEEEIKLMPMWKMLLFVVGGLVGLIVGGDIVVDNAVALAKSFDVSQKLIGLTIVAAGTSLPELATSAVAAYKGKTDIAIGNVVGSNIFNILLILGVSSSIHPTAYDISMNHDMIIMIAVSLLLFLFMFTGKGRRLNRWEAVIFLIIFIVYMVYIVMRG